MGLKRRDFLKTLGAAACCAVAPKSVLAKEKKPLNFVFFLVDDLGWTDLGCFGSTFYETPNVDKLAKSGMLFTDAYAACPVCSPTRASIMTGKYPARIDTTDFFGGPQPEAAKKRFGAKRSLLPAAYLEHLPLEEVTVAEALKEQKYATFFTGKWHLGGEGFFPEDQGFDINKGGHHAGSPPGGYFDPYKNPKLPNRKKGENLPARLADESVQFLNQVGDSPFLLYLAFHSVHTPLQAREDLKQKYAKKAESVEFDGPEFIPEGERKARQVQKHAVYGGMVEAMDSAIGQVLTGLEKQGMADNTAVFFMSDNGGLSTSEGSPTSNLPLRGGKGWLYEGGIREPMLVRWPGITKPGSVCNTPVISTDFYPTMLEMAGFDAKPKQHVDGVSLVPLLKGEKAPVRRAIYWHYPHYGNQGGFPGAAIRMGDYKLIEAFAGDRVELYNLKEDIGEQKNLASAQPRRVRRMLAMLHAWQKEVDAKMTTPNPLAK